MLIKMTQDYLSEINEILANPETASKMPRNTYFLKNGDALCCNRICGDSRFPYSSNGTLFWAHSTGHIHAKDCMFNLFKPIYDASEPSVEFWAGIELEDGSYFPISMLGVAKQLFEPFNVKRYVVFSHVAAYYITDTDLATFVVRASINEQREMLFSCGFINKTEKPLNIRFTTYFDAFLQTKEYDDVYSYTNRVVYPKENGSFVFTRIYEDRCLVLNRTITGAKVSDSMHTHLRSAFTGSGRISIAQSEFLKTGVYSEGIISDMGDIASESMMLEITDNARADFVLPYLLTHDDIDNALANKVDPAALDKYIADALAEDNSRMDKLKFNFSDFEDKTFSADVFNKFLRKVQKQVDICAMGRYYGSSRLGIRDVSQQLEQALIWDGPQAREKMLRAIRYIDPSGRSPRQIDVPTENEGKVEVIKTMDLREYVDPGNWAISCFYSYLAWTGDFSILAEELGYYEVTGEETLGGWFGTVRLSKKRDSALEHLMRIIDYYESNLDRETGTGCVRALFGDWNDAINGLGMTDDPDKKFGTGVSVMVTLHFYQNLGEMIEILEHVGGHEKDVEHYKALKAELKENIIKYVIEKNAEGDTRLIHGWGDKLSYKIGSFCDSDGADRISFAPYAFWVTSGLIRETPELKSIILRDLHALDSRFGLLTNTPAFTPETPGIGMMNDVIKGTDENECVYVHAAMFTLLALFAMGDSEFAWEQYRKVLPICNEQMNKTPFVMSNSYRENELYGIEGQCGLDWFTGGGTVSLKNLVRGILGITADLNNIIIQTTSKMPCSKADVNIPLKGYNIRFEYRKEGSTARKFLLDGMELETKYDDIMQAEKAYIPTSMLHDGAVISVIDA